MNAEPKSTTARIDIAELGRAPKSAVSNATGFIGVIGMAVAILAMMATDFSPAARPFICLGACGVPMILWEIFVNRAHRNPSTGLDFSYRRTNAENRRETVTKLIGLWSTWAIIFLVYWTVRGFEASKYDYPLLAILLAAPGMFLLSIPYVMIVNRHMRDSHDGLWHMGKWVTGQWHMVDKEALRDHGRAWFIKAFFLVFMLSVLPGLANGVTNAPSALMFRDVVSFIAWLINAAFLFDLCFGTIGYVLTFRVLDSHIRSANPLVWAWIAALACYPPFSRSFTDTLLNYHVHTQEWAVWLQGHDILLVIWAVVLLVLAVIYVWATVIFGIRFSNLTHRGIITNGPYRLFKHPAYLSKNIFWWLSFMPFLSTAGADEAIRNCLLLGAINLLYLLRARTEERHLMADPEYQLYVQWIDEHGVLATLKRRLDLRQVRRLAGTGD